MKGLLFAILVSASSFANAQYIDPVYDNYCKGDVYNYVAHRFGPEMKITKIFKTSSTTGITYYYYFQIEACQGDIVAVFRGEGWQCTTAQYGSRRIQFLNFVYTLSDSCKEFIPGDDFVNLY